MRQTNFYNRVSGKKPVFLFILFFLCSAKLLFSASLLGDVNSDTVIDIVDALMVARYTAKLPVENFNLQVADVDGNKEVNIQDALMIGQYSAKLIPAFRVLPQNWNAVQLYAKEGDAFKNALLDKGFVVLGGLAYDNLNEAYNSFSGKKDIPVFITTDALLHLFHITYTHTIKTAEENFLSSRLAFLVQELNLCTQTLYAAFPADTLRKQGAEKLLIFTAVANALIKGEQQVLPAGNTAAEASADAYLERIYAHNTVEVYPGDNYTLYTPGGYYAGDPELEKYFFTLKWGQRRKFRVRSPVSQQDARTEIAAAWLLTGIIYQKPVLTAYWNAIHDFITGTSGAGNSLTPLLVRDALDTLFPGAVADPEFSLLAEEANVNALQKELLSARYPAEKYIQLLPEPVLTENTALVKTIFPFVQARFFPEGLDVAATVFASGAAYEEQGSDTADYPELLLRLDQLKTEYANIEPEAWGNSTYKRWLYTLRMLSEPVVGSAPAFMQSTLWEREKLNTQLASWAELRSDSVNFVPTVYPTPTPTSTLPPTPSITPVQLTGDVNDSGTIDIIDALLIAQYVVGLSPSSFNAANADVNHDNTISIVDALLIIQYYVGLIQQLPTIPPTPTPTPVPTPLPGYVEPNPLFYDNYIKMCNQVIAVIGQPGLGLPQKSRFEELLKWAVLFREYSNTQISGEHLTDSAYTEIRNWGNNLLSFFTDDSFLEHTIARSHAISDIFTTDDRTLHIAAGRLYPVVITYYVPEDVYPLAAIGFVLSYYEIIRPGVCLTDVEWEFILNTDIPERAAWASDFVQE